MAAAGFLLAVGLAGSLYWGRVVVRGSSAEHLEAAATWLVASLIVLGLAPSLHRGYPHFSVRPFSLWDLSVLAAATDDRSDAIKQVYDWNNSVYSFLAKSLLTFLLAQAGLLVENALDPPAQTLGTISLGWMLATAIGLVVGIEFYLLSLIRRIPSEYTAAIVLYSRLRR